MKTLFAVIPSKVTIVVSFHSFKAVIRTFGMMTKMKIFHFKPF